MFAISCLARATLRPCAIIGPPQSARPAFERGRDFKIPDLIADMTRDCPRKNSPGLADACRQMPRPSQDRLTPDAIGASLSMRERVPLFCLGSDTEWVRVGIPPSTVAHMIVRSLVERDTAGRPQLTDQGRAVLKELVRT
jgi:hypothetical protein